MTDLFTAPAPTNAEATLDPNASVYEQLVGDGKKFKTNEDIAKAKLESDRFIAQLQNEMQGLRQELSARQTLEQLMDKIGATAGSASTHQEHNQTPDGDVGSTGMKSFTEEDIARLVEQRLSTAEKARVHAANLETVQKALVESFGPDFVSHLKAKTVELGVTEEYLTAMAKETPKAFLKLVEATGAPRAATPSLFSPPASSGLPSPASKGFSPTGTPKLSYYEELRKKDPSRYWAPDVQNKMHKDAMALGEAFFDIPNT